MMYTAMSTSLALGGPNLTGGILEPRFPQKPNTLDALTGISGAGASTAADISRGISDIVTGNIGEGVAELIDNAPMTGLFMVDGVCSRHLETCWRILLMVSLRLDSSGTNLS